MSLVKSELWHRGALSWKLHSSQLEIYNQIRHLTRKEREVLVFISRRWGKSYLGIVLALEDCLRNPMKEVAIIGPTLKQTRKIIVPIIKQLVADSPEGLIKEKRSDLTWEIGESTLEVAAFDTALESIRGREFFNVYMEETGSAHPDTYEYTLSSIIRKTLLHSKRTPGGGKIIHLTTPAPEIDHPLHTITKPKCERLGTFYEKDIYSNPLLSTEDIEEEIEDSGGLESVHTQRELFCKIVRDASVTVCPEFNDNFMVDFEIPHIYTPILAGDFGGVRDKHAFFLLWHNEKTNKIQVWDERIFESQTSTLDIVTDLKAFEASLGYNKPLTRWLDASGQTRVDISKSPYDFPAVLPKKLSLDESVIELRRPFRQGLIEIHPRCSFLQRSLRSGRFNKNRTDFERTIEFGHLDAIAALIYGIRHVPKDVTFVKKMATEDVYYDKERDPRREKEKGISILDYFRED